MKRSVLALVLVLFASSLHAATKNNDDSCDISTLPAATLLLPYFEVDLDNFNRETTLLTITNVTNLDRIARVTLWTDHAYPVIAFNIYLTGYDVQALNLFDIIQRGIIAPDAGTGTAVSKRGSYSDFNPAIDLSGCTRLPGALDPVYLNRMRSAFTIGVIPALGSQPGCNNAGGVHDNAVGYATVDLVRTCSFHLPNEPQYWTEDIAFENVLTGDFQQIDSSNNYAQSNPMVHIRAVPEGGTPAERRARPQDFANGFPRTFYSRYQAADAPRFDGRQPLPSTFAPRWIQGGTGSFQTSYKIWREGKTIDGTCGSYGQNDVLAIGDSVRFDEAENAVGTSRGLVEPPFFVTGLPATSRTSVADDAVFPQLPNGAVAGWMYLNLDKCADPVAECDDAFASQNWVVTSMRAQERFSGDLDASALGNGCSPRVPISEISDHNSSTVIGPAGNVNP